MKELFVIVDGHKYEITHFDHPGEGIRDVYLQDYHGKVIDEELDYYHMNEYPWDILNDARLFGECEGIKYLGPVIDNNKDSSTESNSDESNNDNDNKNNKNNVSDNGQK